MTLQDIEQMDIRQKITWLETYRERQRVERIIKKLEINEAMSIALVGSRPKIKGQQNPVNTINNWRKKLIRSIIPKEKRVTLWDKIARRRKSYRL